jgi:signal transduction histidine kinase
VRYALALAGKQLAHRRIEVSLALSDNLPPVRASRDQLTQVFLNLIINASEAMPDGGELHISARVFDRRLELAFADSGQGIPPSQMAKLFEPFHTTKEQGTGLGLAVSYSIVQQHGGTITAENAPDGGAIFVVALPLAPWDRL